MGRAWTDRTLRRARASFLAALAAGASITKACQLAKVARSTVYEWKDSDEAFAALWEDALEQGNDLLEDEARRRAVEGVEMPLVNHGKLVRDDDGNVIRIREYSDTLLALMMKAKIKGYRDRLDVDAKHSGAVNVTIVGPDADL